MQVVDKKRISKIAKAIGVPYDLASLVESYSGYTLLAQALIEWLFNAYGFNNYVADPETDGCPKIVIDLAKCQRFPFCSIGVAKQCTCEMRMYTCDDYSRETEFPILCACAPVMCALIMDNSHEWLSQMPEADCEINSRLLSYLRECIYERASAIMCAT